MKDVRRRTQSNLMAAQTALSTDASFNRPVNKPTPARRWQSDVTIRRWLDQSSLPQEEKKRREAENDIVPAEIVAAVGVKLTRRFCPRRKNSWNRRSTTVWLNKSPTDGDPSVAPEGKQSRTGEEPSKKMYIYPFESREKKPNPIAHQLGRHAVRHPSSGAVTRPFAGLKSDSTRYFYEDEPGSKKKRGQQEKSGDLRPRHEGDPMNFKPSEALKSHLGSLWSRQSNDITHTHTRARALESVGSYNGDHNWRCPGVANGITPMEHHHKAPRWKLGPITECQSRPTEYLKQNEHRKPNRNRSKSSSLHDSCPVILK